MRGFVHALPMALLAASGTFVAFQVADTESIRFSPGSEPTATASGALGTWSSESGRAAGQPAQRVVGLQSWLQRTYLAEILVARDSALMRWPDRSAEPIRVWVQEEPGLDGFDPAYATVVRDAFSEWGDALLPLSFEFVEDAAAAELRVVWVDRFQDAISGRTFWSSDDQGWILSADIYLALTHSSGEKIRGAALRAIALHEIGHALGLDHTADTTSVMATPVRTSHLAEVDRATATRLYELLPGKPNPPGPSR